MIEKMKQVMIKEGKPLFIQSFLLKFQLMLSYSQILKNTELIKFPI